MNPLDYNFFEEMELNLKEQGFSTDDMWGDILETGIMDKNSPMSIVESERMKIQPLTLFLKKVFPNLTKWEGKIIWYLIKNRSLIVDGEDISGSFRYNGACISEVVGDGTNYMDFYMSSPQFDFFDDEDMYLMNCFIMENGGVIKVLE